MDIFTAEARQQLAEGLELSLGGNGKLVDPDGHELPDSEVWRILIMATHKDAASAMVLQALFPVAPADLQRVSYKLSHRKSNVAYVKKLSQGKAGAALRAVLGEEDLPE